MGGGVSSALVMQDFFYMGGYAFYVWGSYAVVTLVLVSNLLNPIFRHRRLLHELGRRNQRDRGAS